jgi:hypothetical protein
MRQDEQDTTRDTVRQVNLPSTALALPPADQITSSGTAVLGTVENALRIIVAGLGIVAALGFPAVYLHFSTFGVPTSFISYDHILRAGVLPAILLMLFGTYIYWAVKGFQSGMIAMHFAFVLAILGPLLLPLFLLALAGLLSAYILMAWVILWPFVRLTSRIFSIDIPTRVILYCACAIAVFLIETLIIIVLGKGGDKSESRESFTDRLAKTRT